MIVNWLLFWLSWPLALLDLILVEIDRQAEHMVDEMDRLLANQYHLS